MPSRTTRDESNGITPATKQKTSKTEKRTPADPPGVATNIDIVRNAPRRSKSDNVEKTKKATSKSNGKKKAISRTKSSSATDGDDSASLHPPPIPNRRQSSGVNNTSSTPAKKSGKLSRVPPVSPGTKKGVARTKSASEATPKMTKKPIGRTYSAAADLSPPVSPARQSQSIFDKIPPKSPASILRPSSFKVTTKPLKSAKPPPPKSTSPSDKKTASKSKESTAKPRSLPDLKKAPASNKKRLSEGSAEKVPSSPRERVAYELAEQESRVMAKIGKKDAPGASSAASQPPKRQAPGAYLVQGQSVARAESGVLSAHESSSNNSKRQSISSSSSSNKRDRDAPASPRKSINAPVELAPPVVAGSMQPSNLVVAAELSTDVESKIEEEVRQRILQTTVRANVVSVVHGQTLYDPEVEAKRLADMKEVHKPKGMKEKLFGDTRNADIDIAASPDSIMKRTYLKWTVRRNPATNLWVASVQTSQKAVETNDTIEIERNTLSFSATTQPEAFETGLANATPLLHPLEQHPICYVCKAKFALFRRPLHCRNCGVCVCNSCSTTWPAKMLPETYNTKNSSVAQVCLACDFLANSFRDALLEGDLRSAQHLYGTGNVNVRTPFCLDRKAEVMYPIHLAILGGNIKIVKWLCSERFCPLRMPKKRGKKDTPILTSRNRSPLGIALLHQRLDIVRLLVADMGVSLFEEKDLNTNMALANFTSLLKMLPESTFDGKKMLTTAVPHSAVSNNRQQQQQQQPISSSVSSDSLATASLSASQRRPSL